MAKIAPFPRKTRKDIKPVAEMIAKYLAAISTDRAMSDKMSARMNAFVETYADIWFEPIFNLAIPPTMSKEETVALLLSIEKGVDQAAEQVNEIISKIIIERLLLEVHLYEEKQNSAAPKNVTAGRAADKSRAVHRMLAAATAGDTSGI